MSSNFEPSAAHLASLASKVTESLEVYERAQSQGEKNEALRTLAQSSTQLSQAATDPVDAFSDFTFQPFANAWVRIAISIGLFDHLPAENALSIEEISTLTRADMALTTRAVRALAALGILGEVEGQGLYSHTPLSRMYTESSPKAWATWMWDVMINASTDVGPYFDHHDFRNPTDSEYSPFSWSNHDEGTNIFDIVRKTGKLQLLHDAMSGSSVICAREAVATYDFSKLSPGTENVLIVDVGGSRGQTIKEIRVANPLLKGRMVVQDLKLVVDKGLVAGVDAEFLAYDFFQEVQPVKAAAAYFFQRIFHDWSDSNCQKILRNLRPAMGDDSKLLICDVVIPESHPHPRKVLRDGNMLLGGGMERSVTQWHSLLDGEGFTIEKIYGVDNPNNSIIEAVLKRV